MHRINLLKARLNGEDLERIAVAAHGGVSSSAGQSAEGAKTFMQLYSYRLLWEDNMETLKKETAYLEGLLGEAMDKAQNLTVDCAVDQFQLPRGGSHAQGLLGAVSMRPRTSGWNPHSR
ncbi:MAG: hypothetical protein MZV70_53430 [Desulfobacterales bacterium]|nr:hypothetical protein [Desulfobacterales bacterium]